MKRISFPLEFENSFGIELILLEFGGGLNSFTVAVQLREFSAPFNNFSKLLKPDNLRYKQDYYVLFFICQQSWDPKGSRIS